MALARLAGLASPGQDCDLPAGRGRYGQGAERVGEVDRVVVGVEVRIGGLAGPRGAGEQRVPGGEPAELGVVDARSQVERGPESQLAAVAEAGQQGDARPRPLAVNGGLSLPEVVRPGCGRMATVLAFLLGPAPGGHAEGVVVLGLGPVCGVLGADL